MEFYLLLASIGVSGVAALLALKKGALPYALLILSLVALTHIQGLFMLDDVEKYGEVSVLWTFTTKEGFFWACVYIFAVSFTLLLFSLASRSVKPLHGNGKYQYVSSKISYVLISSILMSAYVFALYLVDFESILQNTRPGNASGVSIILALCIIGVVPISFRLLLGEIPNKTEASIFLGAMLMAMLFSRMHLIVYVLMPSLAAYYGVGIYRIRVTLRFYFKLFILLALFVMLFLALGAFRHALNYTSYSTVLQYYANNPAEQSLLAIDLVYKIGVEGFAGLASAISLYIDQEYSFKSLGGIDILILGILTGLPSQLKVFFVEFYDILSPFNWHNATVVQSGLESSFVSFFVLGPIVFCLFFYLIGWRLNKIIANQNESPFLRLIVLTFVSNGVFFVRGSWYAWLAFFSTFLAIIVVLYPLFRLMYKRNVLIRKRKRERLGKRMLLHVEPR